MITWYAYRASLCSLLSAHLCLAQSGAQFLALGEIGGVAGKLKMVRKYMAVTVDLSGNGTTTFQGRPLHEQ